MEYRGIGVGDGFSYSVCCLLDILQVQRLRMDTDLRGRRGCLDHGRFRHPVFHILGLS